MIANPKFAKQPKPFWAHVRSLSAEIGYTARKSASQASPTILAPSLESIVAAMQNLTLGINHLIDAENRATSEGMLLVDYFKYRADTLNNTVKPLLMDKAEAKALYNKLKSRLKITHAVTKNKQKGKKSGINYLTGIVNLLITSELASAKCTDCDYAPRQLTTFIHQGRPLRTLSRWVDGAFPAAINPIAIWEVKEYYNTKTFGSRVADGVYESLLDGMELEELRENHSEFHCEHLLIVDDRFTWWECGRSYLCRLFDMLHMGYVDEVIFGKETVDRLPILAREWVRRYNNDPRRKSISSKSK